MTPFTALIIFQIACVLIGIGVIIWAFRDFFPTKGE